MRIRAIFVFVTALIVEHLGASAQLATNPAGTSGSFSSNVSCYEQSTGRLVGSRKARTSVLTSADGTHRAYAETQASASHTPIADAECQNTSTLFVAGPNQQQFRPVLVLHPSPEDLGNSIDLVDWSPDGHHLLLAQGVWQWGSDAGSLITRVYDADSRNLSKDSFALEAFRKHFGKQCIGVIHPIGFSSTGEIVVQAGPFFEEGEDQPEQDSCVQRQGVWQINLQDSALTQLPDTYKPQHYSNRSNFHS